MRKESKYLLGAGAAVAVGAIAYLVYKVAKDINDLDIDFENLDDVYYNRETKND